MVVSSQVSSASSWTFTIVSRPVSFRVRMVRVADSTVRPGDRAVMSNLRKAVSPDPMLKLPSWF